MKSLLKTLFTMLTILLFVAIVFIGLFGYIEWRGECKFQGIFAGDSKYCVRNSKGSIEKINYGRDSEYIGGANEEKYNTIYYSFYYPETWFISEEGTTVFVFSESPENENIRFRESMVIEILKLSNLTSFNKERCEDYGNQYFTQSQEVYSDYELLKTTATQTPDYTKCEVQLRGNKKEGSFEQIIQYIIPYYSEESYITTILYKEDSKNEEKYLNVLESFRLN